MIHVARILGPNANALLNRIWDKIKDWEEHDMTSNTLILDPNHTSNATNPTTDIINLIPKEDTRDKNRDYVRLLSELTLPILNSDELVSYLIRCPELANRKEEIQKQLHD